MLIARYASQVYLIYRREQFNRPEPVLLRILGQTDNISQLMSTEGRRAARHRPRRPSGDSH